MSATLHIYLTDHGRVGHSYIGLTDSKGHTEYWGYYPEAALSGTEKNGGLAAVENYLERLYGPGKLSPDDRTFAENNKISSEPIPLTEAQYQNVQDYLNGLEKQPGDYSVIGRNCVDIANGALEAAGQNKDIGDLFNLEQLSEASKAGLYANVIYADHFLANPTGITPPANHMFSKGEWATGQPLGHQDAPVGSPDDPLRQERVSLGDLGFGALAADEVSKGLHGTSLKPETLAPTGDHHETSHREPPLSILGTPLYEPPSDASKGADIMPPETDAVGDIATQIRDALIPPITDRPDDLGIPLGGPVIIENATNDQAANGDSERSAETGKHDHDLPETDKRSVEQAPVNDAADTKTDILLASLDPAAAETGPYATYQPTVTPLEPIPFDEGIRPQPVERIDDTPRSPYSELPGIDSGIIVDPGEGPEPTGRDFIDPSTQRDDLQTTIDSIGLSPLPEPIRPEPAPEPVVTVEPAIPVAEWQPVMEPAPAPQEVVQLAPLPIPVESPAPADDPAPSFWERVTSAPQPNEPAESQQPVFQPQAPDTTPPSWGSTNSPTPTSEPHEKTMYEALFDPKPADPAPGSWVETTPQQDDPAPKSWVETVTPPQEAAPAPSSWVETVSTPPAPEPAPEPAPAPSHDTWVGTVTDSPAPSPSPASDPGPSPSSGGMGI